jgi:DNA polymerase III subunit delta
VVYLFHGEDDLSRREAVKALLPATGSDDYLEVSMFDGAADVQEIIQACNTLPFLAAKRYVLLRNFIAGNTRRGKGSDDEDGDAADSEQVHDKRRPVQVLRDALADLPDTTVLILEESGKAPANSVLVKYAKANGEEREFRPLQGADLQRWIKGQFEARKAPVQPAAVNLLMAYVGPDLLLLEKEIDKLSAYAGGQQVQQQDVAEMVASAEETKVWDIIDAAALGRPKEALGQLRRLLADTANPPLRTLGAITNRFRTMIMIKELADQRLPDVAIARQTGLQDWSVRNTRPLLRQFTLEQLGQVYERLLETDVALKRSPLDDKLTLELLVLDIATRNLGRSGQAAPTSMLPLAG